LVKKIVDAKKKMIAFCSLLYGEHCFDDAKLHFSVLAFVQPNLTLSI
jgi:hypothetical protein